MLTDSRIQILGGAHDPRHREVPEKQSAFEALLAELSACFINLPPDQVDAEIQQAQRRVCHYFHLERSALWQLVGRNAGTIQLTHLHHEPLGDPARVETAERDAEPGGWRIQMPLGTSGLVAMDGDKLFPWITRQFLNKRTIVISHLDDLPEEAALDKEFLRHYGTRSSVMIPLLDGSVVMGAITFATLREERSWPDLVLNRLHVVARIFAHAIARKRMDQSLRDSEARLRMATESASVGLWEMEIGSGDIWANGKARELLGLEPDDTLEGEKLAGLVHPEDVEPLRQSIRRAAQAGEPARIDLRIRRPGGGFRWITWCGRGCEKLPGEPARMFGVVLDIAEHKRMEEELQQRLHEITELKKQLERENRYLYEEFRTLNEYSEIVGQSAAIQKVFHQIEQVAATDSHVLITGETGTGKELVTRAIHAASKRKDRIMVKVNCATLPSSLIESELFGREKGAYTGALTGQIGRFEMADGGTIFLDEIGELSVELQAKLLRVLQEGEFERLGGPRTLRVNVRVIAATNRNLADAVHKGEFRKDLFYRLSVFPIEVPPLRERADDIPLLVWEFIDQFSQRMGKCIKSIPQKTMERLIHYSWPGNIRELRNTIERAMILSSGDRLELQMPEDAGAVESPVRPYKEAEQHLILEALHQADGHIKGPQGAAALLGLKPSTLYTKMNKLGIQPFRHRDVQPS
jgi:PAS domain S-box-containing protein